MRNLLSYQFEGPIFPVNPRHKSVQGVYCYASVKDLPMPPELAIFCTPLSTIPQLIKQLSERGTHAGIVMSNYTSTSDSAKNEPAIKAALQAAREYGFRFIGPRSTGIIAPWAGLNASWMPVATTPGKIALVSQSGSLASGLLEWAGAYGIGFSYAISAGDAADVDLSEVLDFLAMDRKTKAILLYLRSVQESRHFLSAARALARIKPVIAIKAIQLQENSSLTAAETPAHQKHQDDVYDAALRRSGILRVRDTDELFEAVKTLAHAKPLRKDHLVIICNGNGPGMIATDTLLSNGGSLTTLNENTMTALEKIIPADVGTPRMNPIDIGRDADAKRYRLTIDTLLCDPDIDSMLVMHTPSAIADVDDIAQQVILATEGRQRNTLACWLGETGPGKVQDAFEAADIPLYITPDRAAKAFMHLVNHQKNQQMLLEIPSATYSNPEVKRQEIRHYVNDAATNCRFFMNEEETAKILGGYGINTPLVRVTNSIDACIQAANEIGYPVTLRLASASVHRRQTVGNMILDLPSDEAIRAAGNSLADYFCKRYPNTPLAGFVVQKMERRPDSLILSAGVFIDPQFGPVIRFGKGGKATELKDDQAVALPPLNMSLAKELVTRTHVGRQVDMNPQLFGIDLNKLCTTLVALSDLVVDTPELSLLEINPLLVAKNDTLSIDARITLAPASKNNEERLSIRPYPKEHEEWMTLKDGRRIFVRPIRPEDEPAYINLFENLSQEDLRLRFCGEATPLSQTMLAEVLHIDYAREMTFIALCDNGSGDWESLGIVHALTTADRRDAEYAISVRSDLKGQGLGKLLMTKIINYCRDLNVNSIYGLVLKNNTSMLGLCTHLGFHTGSLADDELVEVRLQLAKLDLETEAELDLYSEQDFDSYV